MSDKLAFCLAMLEKCGARRGMCLMSETQKLEFCCTLGSPSLLRSQRGMSLRLTSLVDGGLGNITLSAFDGSELLSAIKASVASAREAPQDAANTITGCGMAEQFDNGVGLESREQMFRRMREFLDACRERYPKISLSEIWFDFSVAKKRLVCSGGTDLSSRIGAYNFTVFYRGNDGTRMSSLNYALRSSRDLVRPLMEWGGLGDMLAQESAQLSARPVNGKFDGDVIFAPGAMDYVADFIAEQSLRDGPMLSGTSLYRHSLGQTMADSRFTLRSMPVSTELSSGYFFTRDGYKAENVCLVDHGVLNSCLLTRYASAKTGIPRLATDGGCYCVDAGADSRDSLIGGVKRGLLVNRLSGARPAANGDFSAVAKNSYYIENGAIVHPVSETMIYGNMAKMLRGINGISAERINSGNWILPWVSFRGVSVSGGK